MKNLSKKSKTKLDKDSPAYRATIARLDAKVRPVKISAAYRPSR